jgi:hypothetical protein
MDILPQVMQIGMLTALGAFGNVNKSNFKNCKRGELEDIAAAISKVF